MNPPQCLLVPPGLGHHLEHDLIDLINLEQNPVAAATPVDVVARVAIIGDTSLMSQVVDLVPVVA